MQKTDIFRTIDLNCNEVDKYNGRQISWKKVQAMKTSFCVVIIIINKQKHYIVDTY